VSILASIQHKFTPPKLEILNRELDEVLLSNPVDEYLLQKIITKRANLVESLLNTLDEQQKRSFAADELISNNVIIELVEKQRSLTQADLAKVNKASKAIKKYHQV
jgi:hypothetical protein